MVTVFFSVTSVGALKWHALQELIFLIVQWNLDLSFFKGTEKTNGECGQTINPENYYTM